MIQVHVIPTRYMVQAPLSGAHLQLFGGEIFFNMLIRLALHQNRASRQW
jgi:hypothetical protein